MSRRLLILRPEPGASATAAKANAIGIDSILLPLFETQAVEWAAPDASLFDAVLMTSANAPLHGGDGLARYLNLPLYAVGDATAHAAQAAGFTKVIVGIGSVTATARTMSYDGCRHVLHLAGHDRTIFADESLQVTPVTLYESVTLPPVAIPTNTVALLHSTRAALRFSELVSERSTTAIVAISSAVADAAGPGWQSVTIADQPRDTAMLALAARLCETREA